MVEHFLKIAINGFSDKKKNMNRISFFFFGKLLNVKNPRIYGIMLLWLFLHHFTPHCVPFLLLCVISGSVIPACRL